MTENLTAQKAPKRQSARKERNQNKINLQAVEEQRLLLKVYRYISSTNIQMFQEGYVLVNIEMIYR